MVCVSTVITLVLVELLTRVIGWGYGYAPIVDHPIWHHWHESNYECVCWGPHDQFGGFVNRFNSDGLAMSAELTSKDEPVILFLGDSFTEALQVPESKRFVSLVREKVGIPCGNFGCSSFSPILSRLVLEEFLRRLDTQLVVLQLYVNDLDDDLRYRQQAVLFGQQLIAVPGHQVSCLARVCRRSYAFRFSRKALLSYRFAQRMKRRTGGQWGTDSWSPMFSKPVEQSVDVENRAAFVASIGEIHDTCRTAGAQLIVFCVPDRGSLARDTPDYFNDYVAGVCAREGVRWLDLVPAFRSAKVSQLYFPQDIHFTQDGHSIAADVLAAAICFDRSGVRVSANVGLEDISPCLHKVVSSNHDASR